jgi:dipeptidyl aminopeptidase/acylaminoacyl peptidase
VARGRGQQQREAAFPELHAMSSPLWSPDGKPIAIMGVSKRIYWYEDLGDIYLLNPAATSERKLEMQIFATDLEMNLPLFWSGDGKRIYFLYQQAGDHDLWAIPSQGGVATRVTYMGGAVRSCSASHGAEAFIFVRSTPIRSSEVDYLSANGGAVRQLTHFAEDCANVHKPTEIAFRSHDGLYMQGFLHLPR